MPRSAHSTVDWTQYLAARVGAMGLEMFDARTNLRWARMAGRLLYRVDRRHRERARANLRGAFPDRDPDEIQTLGRDSFEYFVQMAVETMHSPRLLTTTSWPKRIGIGDIGEGLSALTEPGPTLLVTGHVGSWEVLGYLLSMLGFEIDALARPIDNPLINRWLRGIRERRGLRVLTKRDATGRMMDVIDSGGTLAFIADQNAGRKGMFVPFFGRLASTYKSIGLLAIDRKVPIVCGYAHRIGPGYRHEVGVTDVIRPADWADHPDPLFYISARYTRAIEAMVRLRPAQYFWMHRRWKSRPPHVRRGRPAPKRLRENLASLPWLTSDDVEALLDEDGGVWA